ncbi:MAG: hypothetical protein ACREJO_05855 [Phycisphaerales bacterium]
MSRTALTASAALVLAAAGAAQADIVSFTSNNAASTSNLASFTGTVATNVIDSLHSQVTVTVTNTSALAGGGYLTGIVLANENQFGSLIINLISCTDGDFSDTSVESASPFGSFKGGAALGANWSGGGNPTVGTAPGSTVSFTFAVNGNGAGFIPAASYISAVNGDQQMVFRFRGFNNGGSDKVPTMTTTLVPTPGAAAMALVGGLMFARRRRA